MHTTTTDTQHAGPSPALALATCSASDRERARQRAKYHANKNRYQAIAKGLAITDTDRLNWLIKQGPPGAAEGQGLNEETWDVATMHAGEGCETDAQAVRAAIDAAMVESSPNTGGVPRPESVLTPKHSTTENYEH